MEEAERARVLEQRHAMMLEGLGSALWPALGLAAGVLITRAQLRRARQKAEHLAASCETAPLEAASLEGHEVELDEDENDAGDGEVDRS